MSEELLERARIYGTPLIEDDEAVFIWQGDRAPNLIGDFTDWENGEPVILKQVEADIWSYRVHLPSDAYIEYNFVDGGERLIDAYNRRSISNGIGSRNHYFYMPAGKPTPLARRKRGVTGGEVTRVDIQASIMLASRKRTIYLYQPKTDKPVPLLVVWDGGDYLKRGKLVNIVDNLIDQKRIGPIAMAMVRNGGRSRMVEYSCNDATLGFLMEFVLPLAGEHLKLLNVHEAPGAYAVMGASMGGLMALYTALRLPNIFGKVLSQSGAFGYPGWEFVVFDLIRHVDRKLLFSWMDVGVYDFPTILEVNRQMFQLISSKGHQVSYREYSGGHNYTSWRDDLWRGLEYLFANEREPGT